MPQLGCPEFAWQLPQSDGEAGNVRVRNGRQIEGMSERKHARLSIDPAQEKGGKDPHMKINEKSEKIHNIDVD